MSEATPLRERQGQLVREAALDAVVDMLEQSDTDDIVMPEVARAAGISLRTLYRYFPTREALLSAAGVRIRERLGLSTDVGSASDIPAAFWAVSGRVARHPQLARALIRTAAGQTVRTAYRSARVVALHDAVGELTSNLPPAQARQAAGVIAHLCSSEAWIAISDESKLSSHDARQGVLWALHTLLDALGVEATDPASPTTNEEKP